MAEQNLKTDSQSEMAQGRNEPAIGDAATEHDVSRRGMVVEGEPRYPAEPMENRNAPHSMDEDLEADTLGTDTAGIVPNVPTGAGTTGSISYGSAGTSAIGDSTTAGGDAPSRNSGNATAQALRPGAPGIGPTEIRDKDFDIDVADAAADAGSGP